MPEPSKPTAAPEPSPPRPADEPADRQGRDDGATGDRREGQPGAGASGGTTTCAVCGKERPADFQCGCGGDSPGPMVPEGWDPALTRGTGPRLPLVGRQGGRAG
jgi:hypothetical protein